MKIIYIQIFAQNQRHQASHKKERTDKREDMIVKNNHKQQLIAYLVSSGRFNTCCRKKNVISWINF